MYFADPNASWEGLDIEELGGTRRRQQGDILAQRACVYTEESGGCAVPTLGPLICFHPTLDGWLKEDASVCRFVHSWWKLAQGIFVCHHSPIEKGKWHIRNDPNQEGRSCSGMVQICTLSPTHLKSPILSHAVINFPMQPSHLLELNSRETSKHLCPVSSITDLPYLIKAQAIKAITSSYQREGSHIPAVWAHCICKRLVPGSPVCWTTLWLWRSLPNGIISKKTSINLSTSNGQSRQRTHQKDLIGLFANTSAIQHTCYDLERNVSSKLTVYSWPTIIPEGQYRAGCKRLQKISWCWVAGHSMEDEIQWKLMQGRKQPGSTGTLNDSKSAAASRERDLRFIADSLL